MSPCWCEQRLCGHTRRLVKTSAAPSPRPLRLPFCPSVSLSVDASPAPSARLLLQEALAKSLSSSPPAKAPRHQGVGVVRPSSTCVREDDASVARDNFRITGKALKPALVAP